MPFKAVSLFSGCGGLDLGFHRQGVELLAAIDNDQAAIDCFNYNFGEGGICMSVEDPAFSQLIKKIERADIVLGGFPCQGFSKSGPKRKEDPRNTLYLAMLMAVEQLKPQIFVAENVDGIEQNYNGEFVTRIMADFTRLGYTVAYKIVNAADFGVPQHRRRIFFVGHRLKLNFEWPQPTHLAERRNGEYKSGNLLSADLPLFRAIDIPSARTIRDSIGDIQSLDAPVADHVIISPIKNKDKAIIERIGPGQKLCNVRFSETSVYTWQIPEVFGEVNEREQIILETIAKNRRKKKYGTIPNGNPLPISEITSLAGIDLQSTDLQGLEQKGYLKRVDERYDLKGAMFCSGLYKRPVWHEPSPTIITLFHNPRYMLHPSENRPLTIRECARLQSFPDDFLFLAAGISIEDSYRLIGNAVAPRLATHIAKSILTFLKKHTNEVETVSEKPGYLVAGI